MKTSVVIWHLLQMKSLLFICRYSLTGILFFSLVAFKTSLYAWSLQCYHLASTCALISIFFHCSSCSLWRLVNFFNSEMSSVPLWVIFNHPFFLLNFLLDVCWSLSICVFRSLFPPFPHFFFNLTLFVLQSCAISNITIQSTIISFNRISLEYTVCLIPLLIFVMYKIYNSYVSFCFISVCFCFLFFFMKVFPSFTLWGS